MPALVALAIATCGTSPPMPQAVEPKAAPARVAPDCRKASGGTKRIYLNAGWWCDEASGEWEKGKPV